MFGSKPTFGQPASTGFSAFGTTTNTVAPFGQSTFNKPAAPGFGTNTFGQPANTSLFGSTTNQSTGLFGAATPNTFGQQQTGFGTFAQQPQQQSSLFGATQQPQQNTSLFGQPNTSTFGQKPAGFGAFGTAQPATNTSLFGQPNTSNASTGFGGFNQPAQSSGMFGNAATQPSSAFGMGATPENAGSSIAKYTVTLDTDTMMVKGNQSSISTKQHCITFMKEYANKSLEEIRMEDYVANRKGPQAGSSTLFGAPQTNTGMFGQPAAQSTGIFGQSQTSQPSTGLFGQTNTGLGGNAFGQTQTFGQTTQANSLFGTKPFGTATTQAGFGFGTQTSTAVAPFGQKPSFGTTAPGTGLFGSTQQNTFGQQPTNTGFGGFGQTQQQQQPQQTSLFGATQQQQPPAFGSTTPGAFGGFGTNTQNTGTGLFGQQKPATGFGTGFGTAQTSIAPLGTTSAFGQQNQPGSLFGNTLGKPATTFTGFGQTATSQPGLTSGFGAGTGTLFGQNQQQKPNLFGASNTTGGLFNNTMNNSFGGGLGSTSFGATGTNFNMGNQNQQQAPLQIHQQVMSLATSPYGDNPIYKDLKAPGALEEALKPTNPAAQKAVLESLSSKYKISPAVPNAVKVKPVGSYLSKKSLFEGLEEYDASLEESFTLKPNVKRLILKSRSTPNRQLNQSNQSENSLRFNVNKQTGNLSSRGASDGSLDTSERFDNEILSHQPAAQTTIDNGRRVSWLQTAALDKVKERNRLSETTLETTLKDLVTGSNSSTVEPTEKLVSGVITSTGTVSLTLQQSGERPSDAYESASITFSESEVANLQRSSFDTSNQSVSEAEHQPHPTGITLTRQGYYTKPSLNDLIPLIDDEGHCVVPSFTIGRQGYGNVFFEEPIDVANLNLDDIVHFRHKEVIIYPNDENKPPVGQELNRRAQITLDQVWPQDKTIHEPIKDPERLEAMNFEGKLRKVCDKNDTRFLEYRPDTGSWVFKVSCKLTTFISICSSKPLEAFG